jgi:hypothetical protein
MMNENIKDLGTENQFSKKRLSRGKFNKRIFYFTQL